MSSPGPDRPIRILVTGGAGFVGSHYVRTMLAGGYPGYGQAEVTVLDKRYAPRTGFAAGLAATVRWYAEHRDCWEPLKVDRRASSQRTRPVSR